MSYANSELLWTTDRLQSHLDDSGLVLLDLRQPEAFSNGHIPGARSFDIFGISLIDTRPGPLAAFLWIIEHLIQAKGVNSDSTVVIYDDIAGMRSARLFWFLEYFGHPAVHILNGGFQAWTRSARPVTHEATIPSAGNFKMNPQRDRLATADDVLQRLHHAEVALIDTRSDDEYSARLIRAARGGRIPGAIHLEWTQNLDDQGFFRSAEELQAMYTAQGIVPEREAIPYCQGGYRAAHTYLALRLLGYPRVRNYLGSWGEWGNRTDLPIELP